MKRNAAAVWQGGIKDGQGTVSAESGLFDNAPYAFDNRFEQHSGTSPEELLAAAHASCYAMTSPPLRATRCRRARPQVCHSELRRLPRVRIECPSH